MFGSLPQPYEKSIWLDFPKRTSTTSLTSTSRTAIIRIHIRNYLHLFGSDGRDPLSSHSASNFGGRQQRRARSE